MTTRSVPNGPAPASSTPARGTGAEEFNLWCALNDRPFALRLSEWPEDGPPEWFIEADRGRPQAAVIWGTGTGDEEAATAIAYAFVAGIEWAEAERAALERDPDAGGEGDDDDTGHWIDTHEFDHLPQPVRVGAPPLATKIGGGPVSGQTTAPALDGDLTIPEKEDDSDEDGQGGGREHLIASFLAGRDAPPLEEVPQADPEAASRDLLDEALDEGGPDDGVLTPLDDDSDGALEEGHDNRPELTPLADAAPSSADSGEPDGDRASPPTEPVWDQGTGAPGAGDAVVVDEEADAQEESLGTLPPTTLLFLPDQQPQEESDENELAERAAKLETVLRNFRVRGEIMEVRPGPCVTLFELEPVPGTKSSTIINLADDIARSMSAVTCRIALVPGRSVIGIELPNESRETVYLREILDSEAWTQSRARLPMALGKDIGGEPVVVDLARMPHLLIAGTTGSGKSVGINGMILSMLYHLQPDQCRLIMIDPKMLELSVYDDIPHLLTPVVTDPNKAVSALKWVVREMENRYRAMALLGVRNLDGYNARVIDINARGEQVTSRVQVGYDKERREPIFEDRIVRLEPLPCIVVVVDEMADLMLVAGKEIETLIQRLAQMARAAGIHLIMATQRPSVDVITGTIKANFPTRISFQVTSKIDSRTILGESGAEQLLGQGDMLFMRAGGRISRVHGAFVSDKEVEAVVAHLRHLGSPDYVYSVTEDEDDDYIPSTQGGSGGGGLEDSFSDDGEEGDLYSQALAVILREDKVSVSFVQRHLQIGYNRAARLVERMENEGVVSPPNHVGKREILVSARQFFANRDRDNG
ncbi:DNA translocase FtsK [Pararhodospirillum photometricum]|nr:DNA translocase FtsK [Pararhodospirillum photometricum]